MAGTYAFYSKGSSSIVDLSVQPLPIHGAATIAPFITVGKLSFTPDGVGEGFYWLIFGSLNTGPRTHSVALAASSPQAKGRVERAHGTHQDRLVKKLRLAGIVNYDQANAYLDEHYLDEHNRRYARPAAEEADYHRRRPTARQLDLLRARWWSILSMPSAPGSSCVGIPLPLQAHLVLDKTMASLCTSMPIPCGLPDYVERRGSRSSKSASDWKPPGLTPPYCST